MEKALLSQVGCLVLGSGSQEACIRGAEAAGRGVDVEQIVN